ncbi:hypothetical protein TNIN_137761 [Trichonephila inaurata madagascariensis]|uniref:Uncharacterized protein n=1 Tax=Trichonephila inaurata madagascariensis TaxID=2747483 RepID=A0A8X6IIR3_9ARAC|nr:hypothetical protein TNIN_137761 [Trichonephila inaurata madagascariensis]
MDRPVPPAFPVPPGTPYQNTDPTCATLSSKSPLLSPEDHNLSPATSQAISHDINKYPLSNSARQRTSKFMPRRDGPYVILSQRSSTTFEVVILEDPDAPIRRQPLQHYFLIKIRRLSFYLLFVKEQTKKDFSWSFAETASGPKGATVTVKITV